MSALPNNARNHNPVRVLVPLLEFNLKGLEGHSEWMPRPNGGFRAAVASTRARASMHLFTDSKVALKEAVTCPSERLSLRLRAQRILYSPDHSHRSNLVHTSVAVRAL